MPPPTEIQNMSSIPSTKLILILCLKMVDIKENQIDEIKMFFIAFFATLCTGLLFLGMVVLIIDNFIRSRRVYVERNQYLPEVEEKQFQETQETPEVVTMVSPRGEIMEVMEV